MLPLVFLPSTPVLLAGRGAALAKRLAVLRAAGLTDLTVVEGAPGDDAIAAARLVFAAGLTDEESESVAARARALRIPVNVEDVPHLCDVHVPAIVRRGGLTLTVSTAGGAPALSAAIRGWLEDAFGPEWAAHLEEVATLRATLRARGATPSAVIRGVGDHLAAAGWSPIAAGGRCLPAAPAADA
ncbi:hypothetical protein GWK16_09695 [Roseomonas sp. JC162]|uniref:precorrin-2 dehydrogenase n=1 Tax=Neoroseomonas marina TaxID=1232220 RepID=A0A848EDH6_9PROT|nr:NAD(P)-dependent oxidoreductase [Neoroseomonas marina]NMJ41513.1 hypothetical protein [Neoroseomonas marina]